MNRIGLAFSVWVAIFVLGPATADEIVSTNAEFGWEGALGGVWLWRLPDTPNGLRPTQSWHATGSSPEGDIYVAGMDHATNAALYRLHSQARKLELVGDARSSSEAAQNWLPGETAQKFHTRPLWHNGKVFVATMNRSTLDDQYLAVRGFHWYAYDPAETTFPDLSASEPGGAAVDHGNIVALASDPARNFVYGAGVPTGDIFRYDVRQGRTDRLGRPSSYDQPYVYTGRVMWVDSRGRLYFAAGSSKSPSVFNHIYYYDPETGFGERKDWLLPNLRGLELGQCVANKQICFFSDDEGHIYRFDDNGPAWSYVGQLQTAQPADGERAYVWLFQVTSDGSRAYVGTSVPFGDNPTSLYEVDLRTAETQRLCTFAELDHSLQSRNIHTGYDAWDDAGAFYFASFRGRSDQPVILTRVDPKQLKLALSKLAR